MSSILSLGRPPKMVFKNALHIGHLGAAHKSSLGKLTFWRDKSYHFLEPSTFMDTRQDRISNELS